MSYKYKYKIAGIILMLLFTSLAVCAQQDTTAIIRTFNKVMAFASKNNVFYSTNTVMEAAPVLEQRDTANFSGIFYKGTDNLYFRNGPDEMYIQDSLVLQINHDRKTIWINKTNDPKHLLQGKSSFDSDKISSMLNARYFISENISGKNGSIIFRTKDDLNNKLTSVQTTVTVDYTPKSHVLKSLEIEISMREQAGEELKLALRENGVDIQKLIQKIDGVEYFVRTQKIRTTISDISFSKEKVLQMPSWKNCIVFNELKQEYEGIGKYKAFEITKLF